MREREHDAKNNAKNNANRDAERRNGAGREADAPAGLARSARPLSAGRRPARGGVHWGPPPVAGRRVIAFLSHFGRRKPPCAQYRGRPLSGLCDARLRRLSSPRRRCAERRLRGLHIEMGWRFVFGSSPEELSKRKQDWADFQREEAPA